MRDAACRRFPARFLSIAFAAAVMLPAAAKAGEERFISLFNIHTKETVSVTFKRNGQYVAEALAKINVVMRDWRKNEATNMDPPLIDLIWEIHRELGSQKPVNVISGYRSPGTNERLRRRGGGQAKHSQHILGHAADITFPDVSVVTLRNSALIRERGGVGYYPTSGVPFVHVDTGRVRHWPRLPRQELALLFPKGNSKHVPTDGRPLTPGDFRVALASLKARGGELPFATKLALGQTTPKPILASLGPSLSFGAKPKPAPTVATASLMTGPAATPEPAAAPVRPTLAGAAPAALPFRPASAPLEPPVATVASVEMAPPRITPSGVRAASLMRVKPDAIDDGEDEAIEAGEHAMMAAEEDYEPFPLLPLMAEGKIAALDMSVPTAVLMSRVHLMFAEPKQIAAADTAPLRYAAMAEAGGPRRALLRQ